MIPRTGSAGLTIPAKTFERNSLNSEKIRRAAHERKKRTDSSKVDRRLKKGTPISKPFTFGNSLSESCENQYTFGNSFSAVCFRCAFAGALKETNHQKTHEVKNIHFKNQ